MTKLIIRQNNSSHLQQDAFELNQYAVIRQIQSWQSVLDLYQQLKQELNPRKVLFILEDIGQCNYTSMHAAMRDELYFNESEYVGDAEGEEEDLILENIQPLAVEHYIRQLNQNENSVAFKALKNKFQYTQQNFESLIKINTHPEGILDEEVEIKLVNVSTDIEKFAAKLNGYFSCDFNPNESFSFIQYLDEKFKLEYVGLGASLLFFIKTEKFDLTTIQKLIADLTDIYGFNVEMIQYLEQHLAQQNYVILPYVESLDVFDGCFD